MEISISSAVADEAMALTASRSEMSPLLRQLHSLTDTINSLSGDEGVSEDEIQDFKTVLEGLRTNIKDLSAVERTSLTAKRWMQEVRELCYDTEDFLDRVMNSGAGVDKSALIEHFNRIQSKQKKRNRQIAADFSGLKARAKGAGERFIRCVLPAQTIKPNCEEASSSQQHPLPAQLSSVLGVHGHIADRFDALMDHLVKLLAFNAQQQHFKVVAILGFAGVGKTTLARSLYHNYGARFECRAFLQVSRNPDLRGFLISILSQIKAPRTHASSDVQDLFDNVKKHLQGKRYLIVIDGLWASTTWDIISRALPRDNCYSRIITTTQTEDVAKACCSYNSTDIFEMRPLNNNLQFSGLPFETTILVANLLECNPMTAAQWMHLQNSIPSSLGTNSTAEGMNELLSLIYNILPHDLKTCLLHFNMYPEDYTIRKDDLVKQWVAEGFVHEVNGQDVDVVAKIYFDELINRGLIQPVDITYNNEVLSCTVHHIVLDFIRCKSKEENFISIMDYFQARPGNLDKVRRLSVQFGSVKGAKIPAGSIRMSQIRSLVYFGFFKCVPSVAEYGLLRVLILHVWADKDKICFDLSSIQELFLLRYLKVACNVGIKFPSKIGRLQYLETLDLDARVVGFPLDIVQLQNLLHVRLPREINMPNGIDKMTSLRSLAYLQLSDSSRDNVLRLGKLTNLQDLHLTCSGIVQTDRVVINLECLWSIMEKFRKLTSLILDGGASTTSISCDGLSILSSPPPNLQKLELSPKTCVFPSLPEWIGELSKLGNLKIAVRHLPRNEIDILKRLTTLTVLSLSVQTTPADRIVFDKGFQAIRYFKFACTAPCLSFVEGAMVNAVRLKLVFNASSIKQYDLTSVCFQYLTSLKDISVKFGDTSSYLPSGRNAAEGALVAAVSKHPSTPIVNVQWQEGTFSCDKGNSVSAKRGKLQAPESLETAGKDSDELEVQETKEWSLSSQRKRTHEQQGHEENISREETGKQDNNMSPIVDVALGSFKPSESSFHSTATVMQLVEADIGGLISKILHAVGTARQNKEECYQLARLVLMIQNQLAYLQDPEMMQRSEIQRPLDGLDDTLRQALELVMSCQNRNSVYRLVMARRQVERFRDVQSRIESYLVSHFNSHINITCSPDRSYIDTSVPSTRASSEYESQDDAAKIAQELHRAQEFTFKEPVAATDNFIADREIAQKEKHRVQEFTYKELVAATDNFIADREIGRGGFVSVYMGILSNGRQVAIKRTSPGSHRGMEEFRAQITILPALHHKNIIPLVGYCNAKKVQKEKRRLLFQRKNTVKEHLLIFDYMKNGSLSDHLHGSSSLSSHYSPVVESWKMRIKILLDVSCAIEYLHSYAVPPVIHRNIKPSSILLDSSWTPHLSSFGMAIGCFGEECGEISISTAVAGTPGYIDPEYACTGQVRPESDIYSFGVVMLEVLWWKSLYEWMRDELEKHSEDEHSGSGAMNCFELPAVRLIKAGELHKVLDKRPAAEPTPRELEAVDLVARTAVHCMQRNWEDRPAMTDVVARLQAALEIVRCDEQHGLGITDA